MAAQLVVPIAKLGEVLSPSQTKTLVTCPAKWYFKYIRQLAEIADGALALGRAVHKAVQAAMQFKKQAKLDLPAAHALKIYRDSLAGEFRTAELREDEDAAELEAGGEALLSLWLKEQAPAIQPVMVEQEVSGRIGGVLVRGFVDLVDQHGTVIDLKTKGPRGRVEVTQDDVFQVATYRRLLPQASGKGRLDILRRLKTSKVDTVEFQVTDADLRFVDTMYPLARDVIKAGLYMPNRACRVCSRKYCSFWRACEQEFGGTVNE